MTLDFFSSSHFFVPLPLAFLSRKKGKLYLCSNSSSKCEYVHNTRSHTVYSYVLYSYLTDHQWINRMSVLRAFPVRPTKASPISCGVRTGSSCKSQHILYTTPASNVPQGDLWFYSRLTNIRSIHKGPYRNKRPNAMHAYQHKI